MLESHPHMYVPWILIQIPYAVTNMSYEPLLDLLSIDAARSQNRNELVSLFLGFIDSR